MRGHSRIVFRWSLLLDKQGLSETVHTAPNNTLYNDYVMRPRSYSRGLRNRKLMLMLMLTAAFGCCMLSY